MSKQGEFIKNARRKCGLTQKQLADKLNVSDKVISKWEVGDSFPDYTLLPELAKQLNVEINEILNGEFQQKTGIQKSKIPPTINKNNIYIVNSGEQKEDSISSKINLQDNKLNNMVLKCKKCDTNDITIISNDIFQCNKCKTKYRVKNNPVINNTSNVVNNYNIENKNGDAPKTFKDKIINILLFMKQYQNYFFLGFYLLSFILLFLPVIKWAFPAWQFSDNFFKFLFVPFQKDATKYLLGDNLSAMFTLAEKNINVISWIMSIIAWIYVISLIIIIAKLIINIVKKEKYDNNKAFKYSIIISVLCIVSFIVAKIIISQINGMFTDSGMDMTAYKNSGMPIKTTLIWSIFWSFIAVTFSSLFKFLKCLNFSAENNINTNVSQNTNENSSKKNHTLSPETKQRIKSITKKCVIVLLILGILIGGGFGIFTLVKKNTPSPQNTWNNFISCINDSRYNDTMNYIYYLSDDQKENYESYSTSYAVYSNLSTSSFRQIEADGNYAICEIILKGTMIVSGVQTAPVYKYNVYFVKDIENEWKLLSPLNITLGNNNNYQIDKTNKLIYANLYASKTAVFYYGDSFESMRLPNDIDSISGTFYAHLTSLNTNNVRNCPTNLISLTIPNIIKTIENRAFTNFTGITELYLPKSLKSIGDYAFYNSNNLVNLYYDGTDLTLGNKSLPDSLTFSISYDLGGGTNNTNNPYSYTANTPTFTLKEPTKSGYTFVGWTSKTQTTPTKQYKINVNSIGNKSVKANWTPTTYTIKYNLNGGINAQSNPHGFTIESEDFQLAEPTRVGYTFTGWTYEGVTTPKKPVTVNTIGNKEFTANWSANQYGISYDANGGSVSTTTKKIYYDSNITHPIPTKTDYTFGGWYCNGKKYSNGVWKTPNNITLTAYWTKNPTYTVNHYQQNINDENYSLFETERFLGGAGTSITPSVKTYTGFNSPKTQTTTISANGTRVVNYYYTRIAYSLTIIKNDGTSETQTLKYKANIEEKITISRTGFTFGGYFTNEKLSEQVITMPSGNTAIYAWWKEETKPLYLKYSGTSSITVTDYTGTDAKLQIPTYIGNKCVTSIGSQAFFGCSSLTEIVIPESVTSIGSQAFSGCSGLTSIIVDSKNSIYHSSGNCIIETATKTLIVGCKTSVIPSDGTVTSIGDSAFSGCSGLTEIVIPDSITSISTHAFQGCSGLTSITIPNSVNSIGKYAFYGCSTLTEIVIPDSVTNIDSYAFYDCYGLTSITIPFVGGDETENTRFKYIFGYSVPKSLRMVKITRATSIDSYAFQDCSSLTEIVIPDSVTNIGFRAFDSCTKLTSITIPNSVTSINSQAFYGCSGLTSITVDSKNSIYHSFGNCIIETATKTLIVGCKTSVIPSDGMVTSIGDCAFYGCSSLEYNKYDNGLYLGNDNNKYMVFVKPTSTSITSCNINNNCKFVDGRAFSGCKKLTSITIPDSVTSIGFSAFYGCSGLTSITIPNSVTSIGHSAFYGCSGLTNITIPDSVTSIDHWTFYGCSSLTSITIPNSVTSIGPRAFDGCTKLTSITIPDSVTSIGSYAFSGCSGLTSITVDSNNSIYHSSGNCIIETATKTLIVGCKASVIPSDGMVTSIGDGAFSDCRGLTNITIPDSVTSIDEYAFYDCSGLTEIVIPDSVTNISDSAFLDCSKLSKVYYKGGVDKWETISISRGNDDLKSATRYYYSETKPTTTGNYWHYDDDVVTIW